MSETMTPREMLGRLVAFPTVSRDSNLDLVEFTRAYLAGHGIESRLVPNAEGTKANLYAQIGPDVAGGVVLSGHTDVVPVDGQSWTTDPFRLTEKGGNLYGRGSCDMKGFCATALALVPEMVAADLKRPIQLALSYDEEVGCRGVGSMIAEMRETMPPAEAVIVGEPTMMEVVTAHKGGVGLWTTVKGFEVHSSLMHTGVSAVMTAARLIGWHDEANREARARAEAADRSDVRFLFEPPFSTFHCGVIEGGTAANITAKHCRFSTDMRVVSSEDADDWFAAYRARVEEVEREIRAVRPEAGIELEIRFRNNGLRPETAGAAEALARAITGDNAPHAVSYGTEAGFFQDAGYSVVVCGPGSIEQAHQPDEFIASEQLDRGADFMRRLIGRLAS